MEKKYDIVVYTDGGYSWQYDIGAWAYVVDSKTKKQQSMSALKTTMNRMELLGPINAINDLAKKDRSLKIISDSKYVVNSFEKWIVGWSRRDWLLRTGEDVKNKDLMEILLHFKGAYDIKFEWVKGHAGSELNNKADYLCTTKIKKAKRQLNKHGYTQEEIVPDILINERAA